MTTKFKAAATAQAIATTNAAAVILSCAASGGARRSNDDAKFLEGGLEGDLLELRPGRRSVFSFPSLSKFWNLVQSQVFDFMWTGKREIIGDQIPKQYKIHVEVSDFSATWKQYKKRPPAPPRRGGALARTRDDTTSRHPTRKPATRSMRKEERRRKRQPPPLSKGIA